jgi:hypothetical protein
VPKESDHVNVQFELSSVYKTVAAAIPEETVVVWRDRRLTYAGMDSRIDGVARHLATAGLPCSAPFLAEDSPTATCR